MSAALRPMHPEWTIAPASGSFLLQRSGTLVGEALKAGCFVVPESGAGDSRGLGGEGGFRHDSASTPVLARP